MANLKYNKNVQKKITIETYVGRQKILGVLIK